MMKQCKQCGIPKELEDFQSDWRRHDGHTNFCKPCAAQKANDWHKKNRDKHNQKMRAWWIKNKYRRPEKHLWVIAKRRAKEDGTPFTITPDDFVVPKVCPVFGVPLVFGVKSYSPNSPSLDRIDSMLGYVPGNVQVLSHRANTLKSNATLDELKALVEFISKKI